VYRLDYGLILLLVLLLLMMMMMMMALRRRHGNKGYCNKHTRHGALLHHDARSLARSLQETFNFQASGRRSR